MRLCWSILRFAASHTHTQSTLIKRFSFGGRRSPWSLACMGVCVKRASGSISISYPLHLNAKLDYMHFNFSERMITSLCCAITNWHSVILCMDMSHSHVACHSCTFSHVRFVGEILCTVAGVTSWIRLDVKSTRRRWQNRWKLKCEKWYNGEIVAVKNGGDETRKCDTFRNKVIPTPTWMSLVPLCVNVNGASPIPGILLSTENCASL